MSNAGRRSGVTGSRKRNKAILGKVITLRQTRWRVAGFVVAGSGLALLGPAQEAGAVGLRAVGKDDSLSTSSGVVTETLRRVATGQEDGPAAASDGTSPVLDVRMRASRDVGEDPAQRVGLDRQAVVGFRGATSPTIGRVARPDE